MGILTLNIDLDQIETVEGEGKFEGYTFLNSKKGRFTSIEATDGDGNRFSLKTVFLRPLKTEKPKAKLDAKTQQTDLMVAMMNELKSLRAEVASVKESKPLKSGRIGLAAPATQVMANGTNGVAKG